MTQKIYSNAINRLMILSLFIFTFLNSQAQDLTITSPNGGETWLTQTTRTITWENAGDPVDIMIEYSLEDGGFWYYLGYVAAYDSTDSYTFYNTIPGSTEARIRITDYANAGNTDMSDTTFTIKQSPVTFYTPYYDESFYRTSIMTIDWYSFELSEFNLSYSTDNGATWTGIVDNWTEFSYDWTVPDLLSDSCFIRITDPSDPENYGISRRFSIVDLPAINLESPNGGETWTYGQGAQVSWTGTGLPYNVFMEFSTDGGTTWEYLGYGYSADTGGTASVYVPFQSSDNALVKVSDPAAPETVFDISDASFNIYVPPVIVYYPSQGQEFYNGSETSVSWLANDIDSLKIELSTDGGQSWTTVEEAISANTWGYYWTVGGTPSGNCVLKLSDASDPSSFGLSGTFTILETPVITLTSPDGSEILNTSATYTISWEYDNPNTNYVLLEYSSDSGQTWYHMGYFTHDGIQGSTTWETPGIESENYLLRIRDYALDFVADTSEVFAVLTFPETPICMVTVDSTTNANVIVWEKPASSLIDHFIVYRESSQANVYSPIGTVDYSGQGVFTDTMSNPGIKSYRYKIGFSDAEGHAFPMSGHHQTIHLSINQGVGNSWNLIWTAYQGFEVGTYNIYRSSNGSAYEQIADISSSFNSYTDFDAPAGDVYYIVEVVNPEGCNPGNRSDDYSVSRSNVASYQFQSVAEGGLGSIARVYPNPAASYLRITPAEDMTGNVVIELVDLFGRKVHVEEPGRIRANDTRTIDVSNLPEGIYLLTVNSQKGLHTGRVVINR